MRPLLLEMSYQRMSTLPTLFTHRHYIHQWESAPSLQIGYTTNRLNTSFRRAGYPNRFVHELAIHRTGGGIIILYTGGFMTACKHRRPTHPSCLKNLISLTASLYTSYSNRSPNPLVSIKPSDSTILSNRYFRRLHRFY